MKMKSCVVVVVMMALLMVEMSMAFQCGRQAHGARCANRMCCSQYGYCGTTAKYCGRGCQSQCKRAEATDDEQVHPFSTDAHAVGAQAGAP